MSRQAPLELLDEIQRLPFDAEAYEEKLHLLGFPAKRAAIQSRLVDQAFAEATTGENLEARLIKAGINEETAHKQAEGLSLIHI